MHEKKIKTALLRNLQSTILSGVDSSDKKVVKISTVNKKHI
jgi:hypothetical protein